MDGTIEIQRKLQLNGKHRYYYTCPNCKSTNISITTNGTYYFDNMLYSDAVIIFDCHNCKRVQKCKRLNVIYKE